jgi:hypothetical protein
MSLEEYSSSYDTQLPTLGICVDLQTYTPLHKKYFQLTVHCIIPAEDDGFLRGTNSQHAFLRRGSKAAGPML